MVLEFSRSSAEAVADEEENFDVSVDSLALNCKNMRLDSTLDSFDSEMCLRKEDIIETQENVKLPGSPERPDESLNSEIFVVEEHAAPEESVTSSKVLEYLEQVNHEYSSSYFVTPSAPLTKLNFQQISPLNDLEERRSSAMTTITSVIAPHLSFQPRQPGRGVQPTSVAMSEPASGLGYCCKRVGIGRGHRYFLRFSRWYFGY